MAARVALRLDEAVAARAGVTRSRARALIMAGRVRVDGRPVTKPGWGVPDAAALVVERPRPYVGRGGEKLEGALKAFELDVRGMRALDVGASTGGFTDCLLAHGADHVVALDVGYGQLAYSLRIDPRVTVVERCNFRLLPGDAFAREFDLVVFDASFVSVIPLLARAMAYWKDGSNMLALVKPQFEAGRERVRGGVVRDPAVHREVLATVRTRSLELGIVPVALTRSPLRGPAGNVEFFVLFAQAGEPFDDRALDDVVGASE